MRFYKGLRVLYPYNGILWEICEVQGDRISCKLLNDKGGYDVSDIGKIYYTSAFGSEFKLIHPFEKYLKQIEDDKSI